MSRVRVACPSGRPQEGTVEILGPDGWVDISTIVTAFSYTASMGSPIGEAHVEFIPNPVILESEGRLDLPSLEALAALVDKARELKISPAA